MSSQLLMPGFQDTDQFRKGRTKMEADSDTLLAAVILR